MANGNNGRARVSEVAALSKSRTLKGQVVADVLSKSLEGALVKVRLLWSPGYIIGFVAMQLQYLLIELMFAPYGPESDDLEDYLGDLFTEKNTLQQEFRAAVERLLNDLERETGVRIEPGIRSSIFQLVNEIVELSDQEFDYIAEGKKQQRTWDDLLKVEDQQTGELVEAGNSKTAKMRELAEGLDALINSTTGEEVSYKLRLEAKRPVTRIASTRQRKPIIINYLPPEMRIAPLLRQSMPVDPPLGTKFFGI